MTQPLTSVLHALSAETASGTQATATDIGVTVGETVVPLRRACKLELRVAAITNSGTGLVVTLQTGPDNTNWRAVKVLPDVHEPVVLHETLHTLQRYLRCLWSLPASGDPSATFELVAESHVIYCEPADIPKYAARGCPIAKFSEAEQVDACIAATDLAAGYLSGSSDMPLTAWDEALRMRTAQISAAILMSRLPGEPMGSTVKVFEAQDAAIAWLERIAAGKLNPPGITDQTPEAFEGGAYVVQGTARGWGQ